MQSSDLRGGGAVTAFPSMPAPLKNEGLIWNDGNILPHKGTLIDSVETPYNAATQPYHGRLGTSIIWTVYAVDVFAGSTGWVGVYTVWYDSVNDRLYVFALDTSQSPDFIYTAYITLETGAVTNVGNVQLSADPLTPHSPDHCAVSRSAIDSGNFTLVFEDRTIVINESTGAEISNVASANVTESRAIGSYSTLDGIVFLGPVSTGVAETTISIIRGGNNCLVPAPAGIVATTSVGNGAFLPWGDKVKFLEKTGGVNRVMTRTYLRTEFDAWLSKVADFGGLA